MTRAQAIRKYSVEMCFGESYIAVEDDVFYF